MPQDKKSLQNDGKYGDSGGSGNSVSYYLRRLSLLLLPNRSPRHVHKTVNDEGFLLSVFFSRASLLAYHLISHKEIWVILKLTTKEGDFFSLSLLQNIFISIGSTETLHPDSKQPHAQDLQYVGTIPQDFH